MVSGNSRGCGVSCLFPCPHEQEFVLNGSGNDSETVQPLTDPARQVMIIYVLDINADARRDVFRRQPLVVLGVLCFDFVCLGCRPSFQAIRLVPSY